MAAITAPIGEDEQVRADLRSFGSAWWLFLVAGIIWLIVGFAILSFDLTSVVLISVGFGSILILAAIEEGVSTFMMEGWRWLHAVTAIIFFLGAMFAFFYPGQTFRTLAILMGWFLLIKGSTALCIALVAHGQPFWWLALIAGILDIMIGFWAVGYPGRSAVLLVVWAGFGGVFRGINDIVMAFQVRHLKQEVALA
jgi:uncharacterized membrane protein HdeD (DUF308 family)